VTLHVKNTRVPVGAHLLDTLKQAVQGSGWRRERLADRTSLATRWH